MNQSSRNYIDQIKITYEPSNRLTDPRAKKDYHDLFHQFQGKSISHLELEKIETICLRYPNQPTFQNFLYETLLSAGLQKKARNVLTDIHQQFPDYLFGRANLAKRLIDEGGAVEEALALLGDHLHLPDLYPEREVFHFSEFLAYQEACIWVQMELGDQEDAMRRFEAMRDLEPEHPVVLRCEPLFSLASIMADWEPPKTGLERLKEWEATGPQQWTEGPALQHEEVRQLYEYSFDISDSRIEAILALPQNSSIADLNLLIQDMVYRFSHHYHRFDADPDAPLEFGLHAIFLLAELQDQENLEGLLFFLSQDTFLVDFWLGDYLTEEIPAVLYQMIPPDLEHIQSFLLNVKAGGFARGTVLTALSRIGSHRPAQRQQIEGFLVDTMNQVLKLEVSEQEFQDHLIFCTSLIGIPHDLNLHNPEILDLIKQFYRQDLVDHLLFGTEESYWDSYGKYAERNMAETLNESIYSRYRRFRSYVEREEMYPPELLGDPFFEEEEEVPSFPFSPTFPIVNSAPKIGRNDPCPCGSGKKYKKCCMKKA